MGFSFYNREGLDNSLKINLGDATFDNLLVEELMVTAFDYNSRTPRFFSKYFREEETGRYDVELRIAVGASSSAPAYFNPETQTNDFNITSQLVDGGIICNDPSYYAYLMASSLKGHTKIRVLSLGTGQQPKSDDLSNV